MSSKVKRTINKKFIKPPHDLQCNICKCQRLLSDDHVPPKSCPHPKKIVVQSLTSKMIGDESLKPRQYQNGIVYKTICAECNSKLAKFDLALCEIANTIEKFIKISKSTGILFPPTIRLTCRPNAIVRSLLGHLLSAKTEIDDSLFDDKIRNFIFQEDRCIPPDIHIFYWLYPYSNTVILRDFFMPSIRGNYETASHCNLLKFYPLAFLIINGNAMNGNINSNYDNLLNLDEYHSIKPEETQKIKIDLKTNKSEYYPESCDIGNFILFGKVGEDSVYASPR